MLTARPLATLTTTTQPAPDAVARLVEAVECEQKALTRHHETPMDRGGPNGPKGRAHQCWIEARMEMIAALAACKGVRDE